MAKWIKYNFKNIYTAPKSEDTYYIGAWRIESYTQQDQSLPSSFVLFARRPDTYGMIQQGGLQSSSI